MSANAFGSFLTLLGLETLPLRTERINRSVAAIARFLADEGMLVRHPSLPEHEHHARYTRHYPHGCGPLLTIDCGDRASAFRFLKMCRLPILTANLGDNRTLALHMASTIYRDIADKERRLHGITDGLVRLSIGLENPEDIAKDLITAWKRR